MCLSFWKALSTEQMDFLSGQRWADSSRLLGQNGALRGSQAQNAAALLI